MAIVTPTSGQITTAELDDIQHLKWSKYIPGDPQPKQRIFLGLNNRREILFGGAAPLALQTPVMTGNRGWQTIETLVVGDTVFDVDGQLTTVIHKTPACSLPSYQLSFDTQESITAAWSHFWPVGKTLAGSVKRTTVNIAQMELPVSILDKQLLSIKDVGEQMVQCIEVADPRHIFLAGKTFVPTYNSGGKSWAILAAALQYVDVPGYSAILFRKTYADLALPGALMDMARQWLTPFVQSREVHWSEKNKTYTFPAGSTISFGYLDTEFDHLRYQGAEFTFVGIDECTHIHPKNFTYMFSRNRRSTLINAPIRFRATCNPGGTYGDFVYSRYFEEPASGIDEAKYRLFISSGLDDNKYVDTEEYEKALQQLDPVTYEQLRNGRWDVRAQGDMFNGDWLIEIPRKDIPTSNITARRAWDFASTDGKRSDFTASVHLINSAGNYYIDDITHDKILPAQIDKFVRACAIADGQRTKILIPRDPGAAGDIALQHFKRNVAPEFAVMQVSQTGHKGDRAKVAASMAMAGKVFIAHDCRNKKEFLAELSSFPESAHDDMVDCFANAVNDCYLAPYKRVPSLISSRQDTLSPQSITDKMTGWDTRRISYGNY